ncbi:MAG: hypothetical protein IJS90_01580, partial [Clostridia bacterium]|nr:hypothetical protein [Clostridia bacterium]
FSEDILESDRFLDMTPEAQILYIHYCMSADDDGLLGSKRKIMRMIGVDTGAFNELVRAGFVIEFASGIIAIAHWKLNNTIKKDRYNPTIYTAEMQSLEFSENKGYVQKADEGQSPGISHNENENKNKIDNNIKEGTDSVEKEEKETAEKEAFSQSETVKKEASESERAQTQGTASYEEKAVLPAKNDDAHLPPLYLSDGSVYAVTNGDIEQFSAVYPGVDVKEELKSMSSWLLTNPDKRRERDLMPKFINYWLKNRQENPVQKPRLSAPNDRYNQSYTPSKYHYGTSPSYDIEAAQRKMDLTVPTLPPKKRKTDRGSLI